MEFSLRDFDGGTLDAKVEVGHDFVVLQSRGGTMGTPQAANTDYSLGLKALLSRFQAHAHLFSKCYVDSRRVQHLTPSARVILTQQELGQPVDKLFTLVCRRMQAVGKPKTTKRHTGNANKRIRFVFSESSAIELQEICIGKWSEGTLDGVVQLSSPELEWTEGKPRLVNHLRRERAAGLSKAKKAAFMREHGKLFCENCNLDPAEEYNDQLAQICIEVHHDRVAVSDMGPDNRTRLEDLQCLCANCHRFVHAKLKLAETL